MFAAFLLFLAANTSVDLPAGEETVRRAPTGEIGHGAGSTAQPVGAGGLAVVPPIVVIDHPMLVFSFDETGELTACAVHPVPQRGARSFLPCTSGQAEKRARKFAAANRHDPDRVGRLLGLWDVRAAGDRIESAIAAGVGEGEIIGEDRYAVRLSQGEVVACERTGAAVSDWARDGCAIREPFPCAEANDRLSPCEGAVELRRLLIAMKGVSNADLPPLLLSPPMEAPIVKLRTVAAEAPGEEESTGLPRPARGEVRDLFGWTDYPVAARRRADEGSVRVRVTVDPQGAVAACTVAQSSGHYLLDRATCDVVTERAQFTPALDAEGRAVSDELLLPTVTWRVQDAANTPVMPYAHAMRLGFSDKVVLTRCSIAPIAEARVDAVLSDCRQWRQLAYFLGLQATMKGAGTDVPLTFAVFHGAPASIDAFLEREASDEREIVTMVRMRATLVEGKVTACTPVEAIGAEDALDAEPRCDFVDRYECEVFDACNGVLDGLMILTASPRYEGRLDAFDDAG